MSTKFIIQIENGRATNCSVLVPMLCSLQFYTRSLHQCDVIRILVYAVLLKWYRVYVTREHNDDEVVDHRERFPGPLCSVWTFSTIAKQRVKYWISSVGYKLFILYDVISNHLIKETSWTKYDVWDILKVLSTPRLFVQIIENLSFAIVSRG